MVGWDGRKRGKGRVGKWEPLNGDKYAVMHLLAVPIFPLIAGSLLVRFGAERGYWLAGVFWGFTGMVANTPIRGRAVAWSGDDIVAMSDAAIAAALGLSLQQWMDAAAALGTNGGAGLITVATVNWDARELGALPADSTPADAQPFLFDTSGRGKVENLLSESTRGNEAKREETKREEAKRSDATRNELRAVAGAPRLIQAKASEDAPEKAEEDGAEGLIRSLLSASKANLERQGRRAWLDWCSVTLGVVLSTRDRGQLEDLFGRVWRASATFERMQRVEAAIFEVREIAARHARGEVENPMAVLVGWAQTKGLLPRRRRESVS